MATELTSESTHEDIQDYIAEVIKDRAEVVPEGKSDAKAIAEERDEPVGDTSAETDSGADDTGPEAEETGDSAVQHKWLDDDLKAEVAAYGIGEEELADFTSREELERALHFFDRTAMEKGRKAMAESEEGEKSRDEKGRFAKTESAEKATPQGKFEISLDKDIYDEGLIDQLAKMRDHYESRLEDLETRVAETAIVAEEKHFDTLVDSLGASDLFGVTGKENSKQLQRRQDLHVAVKAQQIGLQLLGRDVDLDKTLVNRVARMVFTEEFLKKDWKDKTRKVAKQSAGRMGGGATRPTEPGESLREEMRRRYKELENA